MIKSLYTIGKVLKEKYPEYFEPWANPFAGREDKAKVIVANIKDGRLSKEIEVENFRSAYIDKYLYRKVQGANGTNLVPTLLLQPSIDKIIKQENISKLLKKIKKSIENNKLNFVQESEIDKITDKLLKLDYNLDDKYLFTMKINEKYFGDYVEYKKLFYEDAYNKYFKKSSSKEKVCSITYRKSNEVWGRVDTLGFTIDDITFSRNGFNPLNSYKMFPVSPDAVKILEGAKRIILEKFSGRQYYMSGVNYFLLPHFVNVDQKLIKETLDVFINKVSIDMNDKSKTLIENEVLLNEIIEDEKLSKNNIYYDIFFYQINNAQFLIKLHLTDVLPSRLRFIFKIKKKVEMKYDNVLKIVVDKNKNTQKTINFYITFNSFKKYYSTVVNKKTIFHPTFFKILESVFYGNQLNEEEILKSFLKQIVSDFKNRNANKYAFSQTVKESFALYQFLFQLSLFKNKNPMEAQNVNTVSLDVDGFIDQHPNFFNSEYKKGIFMLGVLSSKLLAKQRSKLKSEPFLKNLNNLNINEIEIQKLMPKLINKIREYDISHYTHGLEGKVAMALVDKKDLSKTEISYIFTLGMIMGNEFDKEFFKKLKEEESQ